MIEAAHQSSLAGSFERYVERLTSAFAVTRGEKHVLVYANAAFRQLITLEGKLTLGVTLGTLFADADARELTSLLDHAFRSGMVARNRPLQAGDDGARPLRCTIWPDLSSSGETDHLLIELRTATPDERSVSLQRQVAEQLLLSAMREHDAAATAHSLWKGAEFLAIESRRLGASLDEDATLSAMRRLSIPHLGAWCIVDMLDNDDTMRRLELVHSDPAKQVILDALIGRWGPEEGDLFGLPAALRNGTDAIVIEGAAEALECMSKDPRIVDEMRALSVSSLLTVPLVIEEQTRGAITFVGDYRGTRVSAEDVALAKDLANQSALSLERARLHSEALALKKRAELASDAKSTFLGMMSHELRTPLSAMAGYVDLLLLELRGPITTEQRSDLGRIRTNQRYLAGIIDELLNFTAAGSGRGQYRLTNLQVDDVLHASCAMLEPLLREKSLACEETAVDSSIVALADREKVLQILVNVISNSIKYTPAGGRIGLDAESSGDVVRLRVSDSGIGIPADKLEVIFEPFIQVSTGDARTADGVGLGLAISRDLARAMHGELTVESEPGVGSTFTLTLPRAGSALESGLLSPSVAREASPMLDVPVAPAIHREL